MADMWQRNSWRLTPISRGVRRLHSPGGFRARGRAARPLPRCLHPVGSRRAITHTAARQSWIRTRFPDRRDAPYHAGGESSHSFMNPPRESKSSSRATCPRSGGCLTRTLSTGEVMQWWRPGKATCRLGMYPRDETKAVDGFQWSCCCLGAIVPVRCPITCSSSRVHVLFTTASLLDIPDRRPLRIEPPRR